MRYDAVIVGDRFAALSAAALLVRRGHLCAVIAEGDLFGGRARITRQEGFTLDFGVLADRLVGLKPEKVLEALNLDVRFHRTQPPLYYNGHRFYNLPLSLSQSMTVGHSTSVW